MLPDKTMNSEQASKIAGFVDKLRHDKKSRRMTIGGLIVVVLLLFLVLRPSQDLNKVIPGHAYYIPALNQYVAFGSGKYADSMIIVKDKGSALKAIKSDDDFANVYNGNAVNIFQEEGVGYEKYTVSDRQVSLTAKEAFKPNNDYFSDGSGSNATIITGFWGAVGADVLWPAIKGAVNDSMNSENLQTTDIRIDLTNTKISGFSNHKIKCDLVVGGKKQATTLQEVK